ncbi:helix-turn-helix domain-containing protein [bacterium]|nr:helix-turn-helix domain-containing protein [bacterium]
MLNSKTIGNKIADARKKANLSQANLAQQISISPQAVGKWERGESQPDIITLNRLAEILGVDLNYFSDSFLPGEESAMQQPEIETTMAETQARPKSKRFFDWNWDMSQGNWEDADFSGLKNLKEKFNSSNIKNCRFIKSDLSGMLLARNNIENCDFTGSNIRDSKIQSSNLINNRYDTCSFIDARFVRNNIEKCNFGSADLSGTELIESNLESNILQDVLWNFTKFHKSNISKSTFSGKLENCHFEHCSFYNVKFENARLINTFFKYNKRFNKVVFENCEVDNITYAFLKNNKANLTGVTLIEKTD